MQWRQWSTEGLTIRREFLTIWPSASATENIRFVLKMSCFKPDIFPSLAKWENAASVFSQIFFTLCLSLNGVHIAQKLSLSAKYFESLTKKCLQKEWFAIESSTFCFGIWPKTRYFSLFYLRLWPNVTMQLRSFTEWRAHCAKIEPFSKIFWVPQKKRKKNAFKRSDLQSKITTNTTSS